MLAIQTPRPTTSRGLSPSQYASLSPGNNGSNKPYQDQPLSASERNRARQQAAAAMSKPEPAATSTASPTARPSIRSGLNRAGLGTQDGVVGGATPADRARPATAVPATSSFSPQNVERRASQNKAANAVEPGFSGSAGKILTKAVDSAKPATEPGFSGSSGETLSKAIDTSRQDAARDAALSNANEYEKRDAMSKAPAPPPRLSSPPQVHILTRRHNRVGQHN
jgi:hypothetical protein